MKNNEFTEYIILLLFIDFIMFYNQDYIYFNNKSYNYLNIFKNTKLPFFAIFNLNLAPENSNPSKIYLNYFLL